MERELLQGQRNDMLQDIRSAALDPAEFTWEQTFADWLPPGERTAVLFHRPSAFYFQVAPMPRGFAYERSPGTDRVVERGSVETWQMLRTSFQRWLQLMADEWEAPNLWAQVGEERELTDAAGGTGSATGDTPFTEEEQELVSAQLKEIRELLIGAAELNEGQIKALDARLKYVEDASRRLSRRDWANIFVSTIFTFAIDHALGSGLVTEVLRLSGRGLGHLFGAEGFPELPGGGGPMGPLIL